MELLNQTKPCEECAGSGSTIAGTCEKCGGSGVVIDSAVPEILKKHGMERAKMAQCATEIYSHFKGKVRESYERGVVDGKAEQKQDEK